MGASDRVVKLTLDVQTKISDLESGVSKIKQTFSTLKAPEGLTKDIQRAFDDLEGKLKNIKDYTKNNQVRIIDEKKVEAELRDVERLYDNLYKKIDSNSDKIKIGGDDKGVKTLTKSLTDYEKEIKDVKREVEKAKKSIEEYNRTATLAKQAVDEAKAEKQAIDDKVKALKEQIEAQEKANKLALEAYEKQRKEKAKEEGKDAPSKQRILADFEKTNKAKEANQKLAESYQQLAQYEKDATEAQTKFITAQKKSEDASTKATQNFLLKNQAIKDFKDQLDKLNSEGFEELKRSLVELGQKEGIDFGFNVETVQNVEQFKQELEKLNEQDLAKVRLAIKSLGQGFQTGSREAEGMRGSIHQATENASELGKEIDQFKGRVTYFFGLNNAVRLFQRALRSTFETVKDLDKVMTETAVVTSFNVSDMWSQLPEYTQRANELGVSIHDAYEAATLYYQQGLSTNEVMAVSNETLKMARIAGLDAADATDRMTNALRGFNMEITEANAQNINDVYSNLAAKTASNVDEISTAMTKVASLAHNANMSFENTAAFLSQIIETTRESAETAGTALKTVVARFSEVKSLYTKGELLGTDAEGEAIDVNKVSKALRTAGIDLNEYLTGAKGLDDIFMELSAKWDTLDQVQQRYIATMAAGSRQQSRFIALMQDNARMTELVGEANDAVGASQKQFEKTLESLETKLNQLSNAWNTFLMGIANSDLIKIAVDALTSLITAVNKLTAGLPGVGKSLANIGLAIGAFKIGKTTFNKAFASFGAAFRGEAVKSGEGFGSNWLTGFRNSLTANGGNIFKQFFTKTVGQGEFTEELQKSLNSEINKINTEGKTRLTEEQVRTITTIYETKGYEAAEAQAQSYEKTLKGLDDKAKAFNGTQGKTVVSLQSVGIALTAVGGLFALLGNSFDKESASGKKASEIFQTIGTTIMGVGGAVTALGFIFKAFGITVTMSLGPLVVLIAGVTAGITFLVFAIKQFQATSPEGKLKAAKKAAEEAGDAATEAADKFSTLTDSLDEIAEKESKLEELEEGTLAWRDAVQDVNEKVLELMGNIDGLEVEIKDGHLVIINADEVKEKYNKEAGKTQYEKIQADRNEKAADANVEYSKLRGKVSKVQEIEENYLVDEEGNKTYEKQYTVSQDLTNSLARALNGDLSGTGLEGQSFKNAEELIQAFNEANDSFFYASEENIKALTEYGQTLLELDANAKGDNAGLAVSAAQAAGLEDVSDTVLSLLQYTSGLSDLNVEEASEKAKTINSVYNTMSKDTQDAFGRIFTGGLKKKDFDNLKPYSPYFEENPELNEKIQDQYKRNTAARETINKDFKTGNIIDKYGTGTLENLITQAGPMGEKAGHNYIMAFNKVITTSDKEKQGVLESFLSATDWSKATDALSTVDFMKENGVGIEEIKAFWDAATTGAKTYIADTSEALNIQQSLNEELSGINTLEENLKEGKGTTEDLQKLIESGLFDVSQLELTAEGWKGTEEQIKAATAALYEYNIEKTKLALGVAGDEAAPVLQQQLDYARGQQYTADENSLTGGTDASVRQSMQNEATQYGFDPEAVASFADNLAKTYNLEQQLADRVAIDNAKLNSGLEEITDTYSDWSKLIDKTTGKIKVTSAEDQAAFDKLKKSVNKMLNTTEDLSDAFWDSEENMKLLEQAAQGDTDAIEGLQKAAALDHFSQFKDSLDEIPGWTEDARAAIDDFSDFLAGFDFPKLEAGEILESDEFINAFNDMAAAANMSAADIQKACQSMGFDATVDYKEETRRIPVMSMRRTNIQKDEQGNITGYDEQVYPNGYQEVTAQFPVLSVLTASGVGGGGFSTSGGGGGKKGGGGGGGGGGSSKKATYWDNPYDELYNLQEKINESLRTRELLERKYQKLLKSTTATIAQIRNDYYAQIKVMREEIKLQEQMQAGRLKQLRNVGQEIYTDDDGNRSTFASLGVTKYASYNEQTGLITIDWEGLDAISKNSSREAEGKAAEAYISKLEELVDQYEEVRDAIWDIEDAIDDLTQEAIDSYLSFEERVMDALVQQYEKEIDAFENMSDAIEDASGKVLDGIQKQIDEERQARENDKTERELEEKEARLAYLRRDTSGANDLEILQLEKEIEEARQNYQDTLIDQALSQMQEDANLAAEQRATQIEVMRSQLELAQQNGDLWQEVYNLINRATGDNGSLNMNSDLVNLLKDTEAFAAMSAFGQDEWIKELVEAFNKAEEGIAAGEAEKAGDHEGTATPVEPVVEAKATPAPAAQTPAKPAPSQTTPELTDDIKRHVAAAIWNGRNYGGWGSGSTRSSRLTEVFGPNNGIQALVNQGVGRNGISYAGHTYEEMRKKFKGYREGGLADFTGPAWLDGTKAKPEAVLNADDTRNLITLKNILAQLLGGQGGAPMNFGGDNYYDIDINAEIGSDYDVDRLTERVKKQILDDGQYRNVNSISYLR